MINVEQAASDELCDGGKFSGEPTMKIANN